MQRLDVPTARRGTGLAGLRSSCWWASPSFCGEKYTHPTQLEADDPSAPALSPFSMPVLEAQGLAGYRPCLQTARSLAGGAGCHCRM